LIPDGAIATYVGTWPHGDFTSADNTVSQVLSKLQTSGIASVSNPKIDANLTTTIGGPFSVTLQLEVENGLGFSSNDNLISIVRHWVYVVTGDYPSSDSIPYIQMPHSSGGGTITTGQPGVTTPKVTGCISGGAYDTSGAWSVGCWWSNLTSKGLSTVGLLALAVVAGIAIFIVYGPQRVRLET